MRELSTASISYSVFDDGDPHLADSLIEMITDVNIIDNIGEEQMRHFKNYFSLAPFLAKEGKHCL